MSYVGTKSSVISILCLHTFHYYIYISSDIIPGYIVVVHDVDTVEDVVDAVDAVDAVDS